MLNLILCQAAFEFFALTASLSPILSYRTEWLPRCGLPFSAIAFENL